MGPKHNFNAISRPDESLEQFQSRVADERHKKRSETTYSDEQISTFLGDLRRVGPTKPVGYLPISTITDICKFDPAAIEAELNARGLKTLVLGREECRVPAGALYAYDETALGSFLRERESVLRAASWPTEPEAFVRHLKALAPWRTELFDLVADAFGDKKNPGRTDAPSS